MFLGPDKVICTLYELPQEFPGPPPYGFTPHCKKRSKLNAFTAACITFEYIKTSPSVSPTMPTTRSAAWAKDYGRNVSAGSCAPQRGASRPEP
jgi:hypothetical protein